jgi:hypothetical protein
LGRENERKVKARKGWESLLGLESEVSRAELVCNGFTHLEEDIYWLLSFLPCIVAKLFGLSCTKHLATFFLFM